MEQFSLEKYLKNPSRKVVTRRGNPVRIICIDRKHGKDELPIVFLEENNGGEFLLTCRNDGRSDNYDTQYDLFFADEEEELTEFEKALSDIIGFWQQGDYVSKDIKTDAKTLLYLARKELLKDLPKWKKAKESRVLEDWVVKFNKDGKIIFSDVVYKGEYFIMLQSLKILPKEE